MADFLLELRSEEIPARMQAKARDDLARLFAAELAKAGLTAADTTTYATPRRLALIARGLPDGTAAVSEEVKGPRSSAPPQALDGFLRKTGLTRDQLTERDGVFFAISEKPGRPTAQVLAEAIPAVVRAFPWPKSMRWGDASISTDSLRWVRPLHGIVALFGEELVPVEVAGVRSGYATLGHRFHHPGSITLGGAYDYVEKLRACHVLVDQSERETLIRDGAAALAAEAGLQLVEDEGLVAENAGLTEWPVPLLGRFDDAFLAVPPEVIQLTARVNQKYFVCRDASGALANAFICTANIAAADGGAKIVEGNRKVLAARLSDARFFYEQDLKVPLAEQATKLDRIVFHEKLGTVADKVDRVAKLARWLVEEGIVRRAIPLSTSTHPGTYPHPGEGRGPVAVQSATADGAQSPAVSQLDPGFRRGGEDREALATLAERAARLAKADLVTGMVGEFPELQGLMGAYYALAQGEDPRVAAAIRDHYKPVGQGDEVPTAPVTVAVSLADKLDTLSSFFLEGMFPSGSKDPFALRRAALAAIRLTLDNDLRMSLSLVLSGALAMSGGVQHGTKLFTKLEKISALKSELGEPMSEAAVRQLASELTSDAAIAAAAEAAWDAEIEPAIEALITFFADRLKVQQREAGVRHDLIDAVFALGGEDDLVRLLARTRALQAFMATEDGANLLTGYRRAANILKKEGFGQEQELRHPGLVPGSTPEPAPNPDAEGQGAAPAWMPGQARHDDASATPPNGLSYTPEPDEKALIAALDSAEPRAAQAVAAEAFEGAMAALASLRAPIDAFFDTVTVNDPDATKRAARLRLLARIRDAVHSVADFSKIEG